MKKIVLVVLLMVLNHSFSQNDKPKREPFKLTVAVDNENYYQEDVLETPYFVKDDILQIYPSEKVYIETEIKGDTIYSMKVVKENLNPKKTIEVEFTQNKKERASENFTLTVKNPFDRKLHYGALIYILGESDWKETSIIPVQPKLISFEIWPDIILSMVLLDWKLE